MVRCDAASESDDASVLASLGDGSASRRAAAIDALNSTDVVIVQHEYGLYDGADGDAVLAVVAGIVVPSIAVVHTAIRAPSTNQRVVLEEVCNAVDVVVVMTEAGRSQLLDAYAVEPSKVVIIPHGAATPHTTPSLAAEQRTSRGRRLLTWGLLRPGKGIEWAIDAVASLIDLHPHLNYVVAGATHPRVLAHSGESYRQTLVNRAQRLGVTPFVWFDNTYRDPHALIELIGSADLVVLPYDSLDQVISGVLVDAVAAGRPVVSTAFPHAVELLSSGAGLLVPHQNPVALASAIRAVVSDDRVATSMAAEALRLAPRFSWDAVAQQYFEVGCRLLASRGPLANVTG